MKQIAYARRVFGAEGKNKKQIALDVGYAPSVANSIAAHIENKPGFQNAMALLAKESNNLALEAMSEFKARGFEDFSNKDLVGALNAIGNAWSKFNAPLQTKTEGQSTNKLRTVILQQIENQTVMNPPVEKEVPVEAPPIVDVTPEEQEF
jgi:phage terminase small subunit